MKRFLLGLFLITALTVASAHADEFYCEVMSVEGTATVTNTAVSQKQLVEGDALQPEDLIEVGAGGTLDLAYDREWNNVTRVEENSKLSIRSLYPTTLELESGAVYAKLKSLPKDSSFSVQTPTAIASVRGTEYRTTFAGGETEVSNVSDSNVYVYGLDSSGEQQAEPVVIGRSQKTQVIARGLPPVGPRPMEARELQRAENFHERIEKKVSDNIAKGRFAKIPDIKAIENRQKERGPGTPLAGRLEGSGRKLTPEQELKQRDGSSSQEKSGNEGQSQQGRRERNIPQTMSGDEARQAAGGVTGEGAQERQKQQPGTEHRSPDGGSRLLRSSTEEPNHDGSEEMRKVPQEQGQARQNMGSKNGPQTNGREPRSMAPRQEGGGQPFGPDPGRRPQDGGQNNAGNKPKAGGQARPAVRPSNQ